jgi:hypothetical protein
MKIQNQTIAAESVSQHKETNEKHSAKKEGRIAPTL